MVSELGKLIVNIERMLDCLRVGLFHLRLFPFHFVINAENSKRVLPDVHSMSLYQAFLQFSLDQKGLVLDSLESSELIFESADALREPLLEAAPCASSHLHSMVVD